MAENTPQKRIRRRTSVMPGNSFLPIAVNITTNENNVLPPQTELLNKYIASVKSEKQRWDKYECDLKAEYAKLKRILAKPTEEFDKNMYYKDYLEENEIAFLSEMDTLKQQCKEYKSDIQFLRKGFTLLVPFYRNQRKHLQQLIERRKEMCYKAQLDLTSVQS